MLLILSTDLCKTCQETDSYMLAFECFDQRWVFPKAYHLFYETFFKASVGDKSWKERLEQGKPFGNSNTEAFALMVLKNNYIAWMAQASAEFEFKNQYAMELERRRNKKQQEEDMDGDTDDDDPIEGNDPIDDEDMEMETVSKSILEEVLPKMQYYQTPREQQGPKKQSRRSKHTTSPDEDGSRTDEDDAGTSDGQDLCLNYSPWTIVTSDGEPNLYMKALAYNRTNLAMARHRISGSDLKEYESAVERLKGLEPQVQERGRQEPAENTLSAKQKRHGSRTALLMGIDKGTEAASTREAVQELRKRSSVHEKKRRKILKDLKRFTKKGDVRNVKQKGWSTEGYKYHENLTQSILNAEDLDKPFVDLFRRLALKIEMKMAEIAHPNKKDRYTPDRKTVWQL